MVVDGPFHVADGGSQEQQSSEPIARSISLSPRLMTDGVVGSMSPSTLPTQQQTATMTSGTNEDALHERLEVFHQLSPIIHNIFALLFFLLLGCALIMSPVYLVYHMGLTDGGSSSSSSKGDGGFSPFYKLGDLSLIGTSYWGEYRRWAIFISLVYGSLVITFFTSRLVPLFFSFMLRRFPDKFASQGRASFLETIVMVWKYLCFCASCFVIWFICQNIFPYDRSTPHNSLSGMQLPMFYTERAMLCLSIWFTVLLMEKITLHNIAHQFNDTLHHDRIVRFMQNLWTLDMLRKAGSVFSFRPGALSHTHFSRLWIPRPCPYSISTSEHIPFILANFSDLGSDRTSDRETVRSRRLFRFLASGLGSKWRQSIAATTDSCQSDASSGRLSELRNIPTDQPVITAKHIEPYCHPNDVHMVFAFLDVNSAGFVTMNDFMRAVDAVHNERSALVRVIETNNRVLASLDNLLLVIILCLLPVILLLVTGLMVTKNHKAAPYISLLVAVSLIIKDSVTSFLAAILFLFLTHPYDVGDRVFLDTGPTSYFVTQMGLLSTTFQRWDGYLVSYPNVLLSRLPIYNVRRTGSQLQVIEVNLPHMGCTTDRLKDLQQRLNVFVEEHSADFCSIRLVPFQLRNGNEVNMLIVFRHRLNFQDGVQRVYRVNRLYAELRHILLDMKLEFYTELRPIDLIADDDRVIADAIV